MKKIFGVITQSESERFFFEQKSLYEKISKTFDEFFVINLIHFNFNLFKKKTSYENRNLNNIKLPHNFKVITPANENELSKFLIDKNLVALTLISKNLDSYKIQFLIKKYNIRLIYICNLGIMGEHYLGKTVSTKGEKKILRFYFFRLRKITVHYLFKVMTILNVFPKIDIYFESIKSIVNNCNNSLAKKIEKIFPFLKICYFKKIIHINSKSFDMLTKTKLNLSEEKIVFIAPNFDYILNNILVFKEKSRIDEKLILQYFNQLSQFLLELSDIFNKKVTICLHPSNNLGIYKKYLKKFEICKFQTSDNVRQAFIVVFHQSLAITDAIFLKKKIISLKSNVFGQYMVDRTSFYQNMLGLFSYSLDEKKELNKDLLLAQLEKITRNYDNYIKKEMMADDSIPGEDKIINTVKNEYFANNTYF